MRNKSCVFAFPVMLLLAASCVNFGKKTVFRPEPEQAGGSDSGSIIESEKADIPEWVSAFINGDIQQVEALAAYRNRYVFIGKNRGANFAALRQWADNFDAVLDFPQLAAERIEKRLVASASLYPDDEYGEYFEALVKNASDTEYPPALKEETFWIKQRFEYAAPPEAETENGTPLESREIYEFFVLLSIDKNTLQARIRQLLTGVKTAVSPTRAQTAAINRVRQNFFEGF